MPSPASPPVQRTCGLVAHPLREPSRTIEDRQLFRFARRLNGALRPDSLVCQICYENLKTLHDGKRRHALQYKRELRHVPRCDSSDEDSVDR